MHRVDRRFGPAAPDSSSARQLSAPTRRSGSADAPDVPRTPDAADVDRRGAEVASTPELFTNTSTHAPTQRVLAPALT